MWPIGFKRHRVVNGERHKAQRLDTNELNGQLQRERQSAQRFNTRQRCLKTRFEKITIRACFRLQHTAGRDEFYAANTAQIGNREFDLWHIAHHRHDGRFHLWWRECSERSRRPSDVGLGIQIK